MIDTCFFVPPVPYHTKYFVIIVTSSCTSILVGETRIYWLGGPSYQCQEVAGERGGGAEEIAYRISVYSMVRTWYY